jgi:CopG family transcriptional regulator, nickel-responsive regulator
LDFSKDARHKRASPGLLSPGLERLEAASLHSGSAMQRITISLDESLARQFDELVKQKGYQNRSEAVRDLVRRNLEENRIKTEQARYCIATVSYVYNHHERELARRLTTIQHAHHELSLSTMHVHLDHEQCVETVILRGVMSKVVKFAEAVIAERGVRHGKVNVIPVDMEISRNRAHPHAHLHPKT